MRLVLENKYVEGLAQLIKDGTAPRTLIGKRILL
jgi:hypothetical protein